MKLLNTKNFDFDKPLQIENITLYGQSEITDSYVGSESVIGEFSRVRHCQLGTNVRIDRNNFLSDVEMGDYSYTGPFDMIFKCRIGKFSSISYGVTIGPPEHDYNNITTHPFIYGGNYHILSEQDVVPNRKLQKDLVIGNDVWIGCNSTILRGCRIGDGAIIGANSLVNRDVPDYSIVVGSPAKVIKFRFSPDIISILKDLKWWDWDINKIRNNPNLFTNNLNIEILSQYL